MSKLLTFVSRYSSSVLALLIIVFIAFFSYVSFARHDNFHSRRLDLGNMEQTVWNVVNGNGFSLTDPMGDTNISRLGIHADFLLILIAPLYAVWQDARMLLFLQTVIMGLGAVPVYWLAIDRLKSKPIALLFSMAYLLYPPLQRLTLHDFHAVTLSMTLLLFAYWYLHKKRYGWFVLYAILAGLGKETVWIVVGLMGLYVMWKHKRPGFGGAIALGGFGLFYFLYWYAMPLSAPTKQHFAVAYLSEFGDSQNSIVLGMLRQPWAILSNLIKPDRLTYYAMLLFPLGFLPLISPFTLAFALPDLLINALSSNSLMRQIDYQYTSDITPFLFISAIGGFGKLTSMFSSKHNRSPLKFGHIMICFIACIVISSYMWGEIPLTRTDRYYFFIWEIPSKKELVRVARIVDSSYTVSVTNNIGAHFARRHYLYNFPVNAMNSDYAIALLGDQYAWPSGDEQKKAVDALMHNGEYELIARDGDFYAFKRITSH